MGRPRPHFLVDKWVRTRLSSLLSIHHKHAGIATGADHLRWINAYFTGQGLASLKQAHARARQSVQAAH